jgi:hypothetical protein
MTKRRTTKKAAGATTKTVKLKFPKLSEFIKLCDEKYADLDIDIYEVTVNDVDRLYPEMVEGDSISIKLSHFGEIVELQHSKSGGYITADNEEHLYTKCDSRFLSKLCEVVSGEPLVFQDPILIDKDDELFLTFDEESKTFSAGCQILDLDKADEIFKFLGKNLGYTIT